MLSIGAMGSGQEDYYLTLAREDYYLAGGEPPGHWSGRGAAALGLAGTVEREPLCHLMGGLSPDGRAALIQNAGHDDHQPGWDLTFSAPKSVSTLWAVADEALRQRIQDSHHQAVSKALAYLEDEASFTRRGKGGTEREPAALIVATFEHGTSRAQDPQLHTHSLVLNVAVRDDGTTGTIESKPFYLAKMTAGALYRAELAAQLQVQLGLAVERHGNWFEVRGVPRSLMQEFSQRRTAIEEYLEARGLSSAQASAVAALSTRGVKGHAARSELVSEWRTAGSSHGFGPPEIEALLGQPVPRDPVSQRQAVVDTAIGRVTAQQSHFSRQQLLRAVAEEAQGCGLGADEVLASVTTTLSHSPEIVMLGSVRGEARYTTQEMIELERRMLAEARAFQPDRTHLVSERVVHAALDRRPTVTEEQAAALRHMTLREGSLQLVTGMAGAGKTYLLQAARESWQEAGFRVVGAALSGKAADGLEREAGIPSRTLAKCLRDLAADPSAGPSSAGEPQPRSTRGRAQSVEDRFQLDSSTVWVVDEAGMIGTRQMAAMITLAREAGAKLVLVGDPRQLQPIDAGGPFKALAETLGTAELTEIQRQGESWARQAVHDFADGHAAEGLRAYAERGLLTVADDRRTAIAQIATDWLADRDTEIRERLILTGTNGEAAAINRIIQAERAQAGELGEARAVVEGQVFRPGDRLLFTRNSRLYGVRNGSLGTLESVGDGEALRVRLDSGEWRTIPVEQYPHLRLGYAVTTHKAQGVTASSVYVLAGGPLQDRELAYVQASRSRGATRLYIDRAAAGDTVAQLARQMSVSHQKELAVAVANPAVAERPAPEPSPGLDL